MWARDLKYPFCICVPSQCFLFLRCSFLLILVLVCFFFGFPFAFCLTRLGHLPLRFIHTHMLSALFYCVFDASVLLFKFHMGFRALCGFVFAFILFMNMVSAFLFCCLFAFACLPSFQVWSSFCFIVLLAVFSFYLFGFVRIPLLMPLAMPSFAQ